MDEIDCANFFDHIDDLLDFPEDNHNADHDDRANSHSFPAIWPTDVFPSYHTHTTASDLSAQLAVPYEDIVQMEWLSTFVEDSFSGGSMTIDQNQQQDSYANVNHNHSNQFHSSSPVSVLESSSSCSGGKPTSVMTRSPDAQAPPGPGRCGRARSKRPRPPTFNPRLAMQLISPTSSFAESVAESRPMIKIPKPKKKMKVSLPSSAENNDHKEEAQQLSQVSVRKCKHCEITKTPQWRAGPMGPKTLCNACGVRYKSGRLFPEYRPAASPTFVASLHSNSHKKVVEMRIKGCDKIAHPEPEVLIPNTNPILLLDYM